MTADHPIPAPTIGEAGGGFAAEAETYRLIVENVTDLIVRGDAARNRTYVSPSARELLGYEPAELLGKHAYQLVHHDDLARVEAVFAAISAACPCANLTFRMRRRDGTYVWVDARYRHLTEDGGILAVLRDITAQKRAEDMLAEANARLETANHALHRLAHRDGLTGLANRRRFDEHLAEEFRRARRDAAPLGLVLLDVDCFKAYNDRYGHIAGDDCLRRVCRSVELALQRPGDHAARYGGEELAVLLPATDLPGTLAMADRLRDAVAALAIKHLASPHGIVTLSGGASSIVPWDAEGDPLHLIGAADGALYQAKAAGRNCVRGAPCDPRPVWRPTTRVQPRSAA